MKVLYMAGLPHSGTTLLARILGEAEGLFPAGEVYALSERIENGDRCGCGAPLGECAFWGAVLGSSGDQALKRLRTERRWIQGRTLPALALGRDRARLEDFRQALAQLYEAIAAESGARVIVDSSKSPTFAYIAAGAPGVELYVVHLVRDPRATSYSWSVDPHFHRTRGPAFGARWTLWNVELEALGARRRARFLRLRFEDFLRSPEAVTRRALGLVGTQNANLPFVDGDAVQLPSHHMIEGHHSRFDTGIIPIRASTTWQRQLSARRALTTSVFASPLQLLYGYPVAGRA